MRACLGTLLKQESVSWIHIDELKSMTALQLSEFFIERIRVRDVQFPKGGGNLYPREDSSLHKHHYVIGVSGIWKNMGAERKYTPVQSHTPVFTSGEKLSRVVHLPDQLTQKLSAVDLMPTNT